MDRAESIEKWARTAPLPEPPRWGEIEAAILARAPQPDSGFRGGAATAIVLGLAVLLYGSPLIALAIVAANARPDLPLPAGASLGASIAFFAAFGAVISTLAAWRGDRQWRVGDLIVAGGTGAASLAAYLIVRPAAAEWVGLLALCAAVIGLGTFAVILVASKPGRPTRLPFILRVRTVLSPVNEAHYRQARERGLKLLGERDAVELDDTTWRKLNGMPLGSWHTADPPGRG